MQTVQRKSERVRFASNNQRVPGIRIVIRRVYYDLPFTSVIQKPFLAISTSRTPRI